MPGLLDVSVVVHLTVDPSEWGTDEANEPLPDSEIAEDVAKDMDIAVRRELNDIAHSFSGYEVVLCEREYEETP